MFSCSRIWFFASFFFLVSFLPSALHANDSVAIKDTLQFYPSKEYQREVLDLQARRVEHVFALLVNSLPPQDRKKLEGVSLIYTPQYEVQAGVAQAKEGPVLFVHDGLLLFANNDDELALIIGHEIGHILSDHYSKRQISKLFSDILGGVVESVLVGQTRDGTRQWPTYRYGGLISRGIASSFSREYEQSADEIAVNLMDLSGFDVNRGTQFFERLSLTTNAQKQSFFDTHPLSIDRYKNLKNIYHQKYVRENYYYSHEQIIIKSSLGLISGNIFNKLKHVNRADFFRSLGIKDESVVLKPFEPFQDVNRFGNVESDQVVVNPDGTKTRTVKFSKPAHFQ